MKKKTMITKMIISKQHEKMKQTRIRQVITPEENENQTKTPMISKMKVKRKSSIKYLFSHPSVCGCEMFIILPEGRARLVDDCLALHTLVSPSVLWQGDDF